MSDIDDDGRLVAFAEGKLDEAAARELQARLDVDAALRERLELIRKGGLQFDLAFRSLLAAAPVARMEKSLADLLEAHPIAGAKPWSRLWSGRSGPVAAAIALLIVGIAIGRFASFHPTSTPQQASSSESQDDWRDAVANYAELFTADSFAGHARDANAEASDLARLGGNLGVDLTPDRIAIAKGKFLGAQALNYDGAPLGLIAYADPNNRPILFCIIADGERDAGLKLESRGDFSLASWARGGRGYLVIERADQEQVADLARALMPKF
jgi:anti-sigma factor RsiW